MDMRRALNIVLDESSEIKQPLQERSALGSAWVLISCPDTEEVLLAKRAKQANNAGQWNLFGGGIESGESALATAMRELEEEAGLVFDKGMIRFKGVIKGMNFFVVSMPRQAVESLLRPSRNEVAKVRWFSFDDLPDNLHKSTKMFIKAFTRRSMVGETLQETLQLIEFQQVLFEDDYSPPYNYSQSDTSPSSSLGDLSAPISSSSFSTDLPVSATPLSSDDSSTNPAFDDMQTAAGDGSSTNPAFDDMQTAAGSGGSTTSSADNSGGGSADSSGGSGSSSGGGDASAAPSDPSSGSVDTGSGSDGSAGGADSSGSVDSSSFASGQDPAGNGNISV